MTVAKHEKILILDFGGQYNQLIARRVRELNVYSEVKPYTISIDEIKRLSPSGIIFTGGPNSVYGAASPNLDGEIFDLGIPILGICYGAQLIAHKLGGSVNTAPVSEYGRTEVTIIGRDALLKDIAISGTKKAETGSDIDGNSVFWMSHTDYIASVPKGFKIIASTPVCPVAAMENADENIYAVQFHPEVTHSVEGMKLFKSFVYDICGCTGDWKMDAFAEEQIKTIRERVGSGKALCALSGGVDSSVAAVLMSKAIGDNLTCVFVDHGLLRKDEADEVERAFGREGEYDLNFIRVDARERFYERLKGITEPEEKRKIIGEEFIRVFEEEAKKIGKVDFLVQGTIYPDIIESGKGDSAVIKSHHNVGGLPEHVDFKEIIEPLKSLFKDEVRSLGLALNIPEYLVYRQPFPGPGLGIRIIGEVDAEKVKIVQEADAIFREEIAKAGLDMATMKGKSMLDEDGIPRQMINQYFAALTNMRSVGVMGDFRTYDYAIALRAVQTSDFMTANIAHLPWELIDKVATRIINEVDGVNRVFYDCTGKPPGTIELE